MRAVLILLLAALAAYAQDDPDKSLTFRAGGAWPTGKQLRGLDSRPLLGLNYGYRWTRHAQFDLGFDTVFQPFKQYFSGSRILGDVNDHLFLVPVGVRGILPFADDRLHAFAGAGGVYMRYQISPGTLTNFCGVCESRNLGGYYAQAGGNAALDYSRRFRAGASARYYTGYSSIQGYHTINRWWTFTADFTVTFK